MQGSDGQGSHSERERRLALELAEARLSLDELSHLARIGTWSWDVLLDRVIWSEEMYRITGIQRGGPVAAATYQALYHPEDADRMRRRVQQVVRDGDDYAEEYRIIRTDGVERWVEGRGVAEVDASGRTVRLFGTVQDITDRKQAELRRAELESAQKARAEAEASARRLALLAEASALLASSLHYGTTLANVARLAVPALADWCAVDLLVQDRIERVTAEHSDPEKLALVRRLEEDYPPDHSQPHGVGQVIRTGQPELMTEIPAQLLEGLARDAQHAALIRELGLRSALIVPLVARERVLGAITLVQAESGRHFVADDVGYASDLARRAAVAIDNARLIRDLEEVQQRLEEQSAELEAQTEQLEAEAVRGQALLRELDTERARLEAIVAHAPVGIVFAEAPSGRILMGNPAVERIFRHPVRFSPSANAYDEWVGFHEDGRQVESHEYPLARALATGRPAGPDDYLYQRGDGTRAWVRLAATPVHNADGNLAAALVIVTDIDAERQAAREREELLRQVNDERRLLRDVVENSPAVTAIYAGPDHIVRMVNPAWEATVGKPGAEGRPFADVFPEFSETGLYGVLRRIYQSGETYSNPELYVPLQRRDDGELEDTWWNLVWLPLPWKKDGTRDILVHAVEMTAQVRARRQVQGLSEAALAVQSAETLEDRLRVITDHARTIIGAHQAVSSMTIDRRWAQALTAVSLSDKYADWRDYATPPTGDGIYAMVAEGNRAVRLTQEELEQHPRWQAFGRHAPEHPPMRGWLAAPLVARDGSNLGLIQLSDRIHGEFTAEDESILVQLAQMASVTIENTQLYERALEASRTKSDFLATMSHELRTPLNAMIGYSELLSMGVPEPIGEAARGQVERIRLAAQHLLQLIEEILTFSRVEAGRENVNLDDVSLHALTREVRAIIEPLADQRELDFDVGIPDADIVLHTDPRKLRQVLLNLLGNAIKFTERGTVAFRAARHDGTMEFVVEDTGIGMTSDELERIFEPFWQAETAIHARSSGTGLGLPVSRQLVELLGGSIAVRSEHGSGSRFTITLPVRYPAGDDASPDSAAPATAPTRPADGGH